MSEEKNQAAAAPIALVKSVEKQQVAQAVETLAEASSFLTDGLVSPSSDTEDKTPIKIWRDSAVFQSVILKDALPFTDKTFLGSHALVKGFGRGFWGGPTKKSALRVSRLVSLSPQPPIDGVTLPPGNY